MNYFSDLAPSRYALIAVRYTLYLSIYSIFFSRKMAVPLLTYRQHIRISSGAFLPVASRFFIVLIDNVSIPISHGVLFSCLTDEFD